MAQTNGNRKFWLGVVGMVIGAVLVATIIGGATTVIGHDREIAEVQKAVDDAADHGDRLTRVETTVEVELRHIKQSLRSIVDKLERE